MESEIPKYFLTPTYLLNLLKNQENLDSLVSRLEKLEIIEENPTKYWERDKVYCKLNIINPNLTIKAQDFKYTNWKIKECAMHIKQLLDLGVIQRSTSRHITPTFIVNKGAKQKRGQSKMIFNYKHLNDNYHENGYKILGKDQLINKIRIHIL